MALETEAEIRNVWSSGSYSEFDENYLGMAARLIEGTAVSANDVVLDVGCGTGNVAITAARRGARVTGLDITPAMLDRARENADIAGVEKVEWREGNATDLPFEDETFDVVLSALGHMYGDPPDDAARELLRVTRSGGRIGFTSWTPTSLFPSMAGLVVSHLSPEDLPEFSEPPFLWGDPDAVTDRLKPDADAFTFDIGTVRHRALSPIHFLNELATHSGLFITFMDKVENRSALRQKLIEAIEPHFDEGKNVIEMEYLLTTGRVN